MRQLRLLLLLLVSASVLAAAMSPTYTWSGAAGDHLYNNPANWSGGVVPPNNGSANVVFGDSQDNTVVLPLILNVGHISFTNSAGSPYNLDSAFLTLLTIQDGVSGSLAGGTGRIGNNITLNLAGSQSFNVASGSLEIAGAILGGGDLVKTGSGNLRISGINLILGNTQVDAGSLIFSKPMSLPSSGLISASSVGYVGAENAATLKIMLGQLNGSAFFGSIGLDSAPGASSPAIYSDQIDVTGLANYAGLGTTTTAKLVGNLRVGAHQDYRFSGGDGTLIVETNLTNNGSGLQVVSAFGQPLTVVLRGSNNFSGTANVLNSVLVLDSNQAMSLNKALNLTGPGYIGATERYGNSVSGFLSQLRPTSSNSIAGFDSTDVNSPRTINSAIDLSVGGTRTNPYYLGTSTKVTLTGTITPTVGSSLYLTAVKGGHLIVASTLGNNIPGLVVGQANSFDPQGGTVEITGQNTYTGGTTVLGGTLRVSNNAALGLGGVGVGSGATLDINNAVVFSNPFSLAPGGRLSGRGTISTPGGSVIGPGAILSPGGPRAIGTLTFNTGLTLGTGSRIEFNIANATGTPGQTWDLINVSSGLLNLTATSGSPIIIALSTLSNGDSSGNLDGFNNSNSYNWLFASTGNVNGFSSDKFAFDTTAFGSSLNGGSFFVSQGNAGLSINFTPVPEPGTYVLLAIGLTVMAIRGSRRRKK